MLSIGIFLPSSLLVKCVIILLLRRQQLLEGDNKQSDEKVKGSEIQLHFVIFRLYSSLACINCSTIGNDKQEC